ncbi:MAG TPA: poly-beta-1,6 N-acetyl-D-glucosamine synthase, partial [Agitococcus sp.]|nr:poly-beta-1,6 N-acetyl-D-glucosamine synthase [Agitococcus sp.]
PHALVWILMPETLEGLWKQRLRWAMGGAQVLIKNLDVIKSPIHNHLWPLMLELCLSLLWSYAMLIMFVLWLLSFILPLSIPFVGSPLIPDEGALLLGTTCLLQFALSKWLDSGYDKGLGRNYYWMIWYPLVFWLINICSTIVAFPKVILLGKGQRARWVSPDRGIKPHS